ncbi:MAG TPA: response regulator [Methylibium sp.]|nr:response regulator [Methylibium sp.]
MPSSTDADPPAASFSTAAVARRLGVSVPTVQRWVDLGHLKAWKTVGGHRRIDAASVASFIESRDPQEGGRAAPSVLIVDDNPDDRDLLSALVEAALPGALVSVAENGFEGLLKLGQQTPDVLVTDIVMPHMNGFEMLRHVATQSAARPRVVLAVSSRSPRQFAELGRLPEDVRFIPKPIDAERFVAALREAAGTSDPGGTPK